MESQINPDRNTPLALTERQKWLCKHLDNLNSVENFCPGAKASDLFKSALYITQKTDHSELPDWMAEAAHSIRELLYPLQGRKRFEKDTKTKKERIKDIILLYQEEDLANQLAETIFTLYDLFTKIAHHALELKKPDFIKRSLLSLNIPEAEIPVEITKKIFSLLIDRMEIAWLDSNPMQVKIHDSLDRILSQPISSTNPNQLRILVSFNLDAKMYFFAKAGADWANWLWDNGFLDELKKKREPAATYHRSPELSYLVRIAEISPSTATDIILTVPISSESVNPETIERFLWICRSLPQPQLARVIPKIHKEKWIQLLGAGNHWFEHEKIVKSLFDAADFKNLLLFAESLLDIRPDASDESKTSIRRTDTPFYFEDLSETKLFAYLDRLEREDAKRALELVAATFAKVINLSATTPTDGTPFIHTERFPFYDVDFYTLALGSYTGPSYREEVVQLAALLKSLFCKLISQAPSSEEKRSIYTRVTALIPESVASWRLRFFMISLSPNDLSEQAQEAIFKIFDSIAHRDWLTRGAEYKKLLQHCFKILPDATQRLYVEKIIHTFGQEDDRRYGSVLLSMIWEHLSPAEIEQLKAAGYTRVQDYKPHPSVTDGGGGWIRATSPISEEDLAILPIPKIVELLKTTWTPTKLEQLNKEADFLTPINPEGLSETIKSDYLKRPGEYISSATLFFDRERLAPHYTYAFLRMIPEALKENEAASSTTDWTPVLNVLSDIRKSAENAPFESPNDERRFHAWVAGWDSVYSAQAELLKNLLHKNIEFTASHEEIAGIIEHLLSYPDPTPDEEISKGGAEDALTNDPYSIAINSVRGKAFEALVTFAEKDWEKREKRGNPEISILIKGIYEALLKTESTRAIRFLYGIFLPFFYSRDKAWIISLFSEIFTSDTRKKHLYLASWEGYLTARLYSDIFLSPEFQQLYSKGLSISIKDDPNRKFFTEPDKGLGRHIGLAFGHFDEFTTTSPLFKEFWEKGTSTHHTAFISIIGKSILSKHSYEGNSVLKEKPETLEKLKGLWDWLLQNCHSKGALLKFGSWINHEHTFFNLAWLAPRIKATLKKTNGTLEWTHGLTNLLPSLATAAPTDTAEIARMFFYEAGIKSNDPKTFFHWDEDCYETLQVLFGLPETKAATEKLINDMLREGNGRFWKLKEILNANRTGEGHG